MAPSYLAGQIDLPITGFMVLDHWFGVAGKGMFLFIATASEGYNPLYFELDYNKVLGLLPKEDMSLFPGLFQIS